MQSLWVSADCLRLVLGYLFQLFHVDPSLTIFIIDVRVTKTNKNLEGLLNGCTCTCMSLP